MAINSGKIIGNVGPILIFILVAGLAGVIIKKAFTGAGIARDRLSITHGDKKKKEFEKKKTIDFVPADFDLNMNDEDVLAILKNPDKYSRQFDDLVRNINLKVLRHVANRMDLPKDLRKRIESEYEQHHKYLKQQYLRDLKKLRDPASDFYQSWYKNKAKNAVKLFSEVTSKYTCYIVDLVISEIVESGGYDILQKNKKMETPCGIALEEAVYPMMERLEKRAAIDDFSESKGLLEKKVENAIAELAVMEVKDKKALDKTLAYKIFGFNVSSTDVQISAVSTLKVGYKLDRFFSIEVKPRHKEVIVTLPQPEILSHEVYPRVDKLDIGWMKKIDKESLNQYINDLREAFREDAYRSDIFDKSKKQVEDLLNMILGPVVKQIDPKYKIVYRYKNVPT